MKVSKKIILFLVIIILLLGVLILGYRYFSTHIFEKKVESKEKLIKKIKQIEDDVMRANAINHFLESNVLMQDEANSLY